MKAVYEKEDRGSRKKSGRKDQGGRKSSEAEKDAELNYVVNIDTVNGARSLTRSALSAMRIAFLIPYDPFHRKIEAKPVLPAAGCLPSGDSAPAGASGSMGKGIAALIAPGVDGPAH